MSKGGTNQKVFETIQLENVFQRDMNENAIVEASRRIESGVTWTTEFVKLNQIDGQVIDNFFTDHMVLHTNAMAKQTKECRK